MGLNLGVDEADQKSVDEVMEVVRAARAESAITYADFNTGHYAGDTYLDIPSSARSVPANTPMPVFQRLYEACMERGLPIGCAPNVHASLVLLPEESRGFSSRSFLLQRARLRALAAAFHWRFERRLAAWAG